MARNAFLLAYDIRDPARWRDVHRLALGHGFPVQLSIFRCELSLAEFASLKGQLEEVIHHRLDEVMIVDLGPVDGTEKERTHWLGKRVQPPERGPTIV